MFGKRAADSDMTEGVVWRKLLLFFFPIWFGAIFQQLYNTVDAVIVGQFVGTGALAAVGATGTLVMVLGDIMAGIASGASVVVAQKTGAAEDREVGRAVGTAMAAALWLGLVFSAAGVLGAPWMLRAMGTPPDVLADSVLYMQIYFLGMVPSLLYNVGTGVLRAIGDSRRPLCFLVAASCLNILLDILFVVAFGLGVLGVAAATVISQAASALMVLASLLRAKGQPHRLPPRMPRVEWDLLAAMARISLPAILQMILYDISNVLIQVNINAFGTTAVAAWAVFGKLDSLFWMTIKSLGLAVTTFAGQNFGARRYDRLKQGARQAIGLGVVFTLAIIALLLGLGERLFGFFTADGAVIETGLVMIRFIAPWYLSFICIEVLSATMRSAGESFIPTLITCLGVCGVRLAWLFVMVPRYRSIPAVLASYPASWCVAALLYLAYYLPGGWLRRRIAAQDAEQSAAAAPQ